MKAEPMRGDDDRLPAGDRHAHEPVESAPAGSARTLGRDHHALASGAGTASPSAAARKIRVCHIVATTEGAVWAFEQVRDLRDRYGYDVSVILNGSTGSLVDRFQRAGIPVLTSDFDFLGTGDLRALPRKIWSLRKLLERERFDVVQTHLFHSMVIGRLASWLADVPVRLSMVAGPFHLEAYTPRWIDGSTQWMETALIPSCEYSRRLYLSMGVAPERLHVIYYGPDEANFDPAKHVARDFRAEYGWPADTPLIGMVAYFYAELGINRWTPPAVQGRSVKCQADLVMAMPAILQEFPNAKLLLVGKGWEEGGRQYHAKVRALVDELGLGEQVRFTDYVESVPPALKSFDVVVQASRSENLGGTIEGLLMECPMVVTKVGGLVESVLDGETGVQVAPADPQDLARGIKSLLRDRELARRLSQRGRRFMLERFSLRRTVDDEDALYRALLAEAPRGYRGYRQALRVGLGIIVGCYLVARYRILDAYYLPALDAGWRPWQFVTLRRFILRCIRLAVHALSASRRLAPPRLPNPLRGAKPFPRLPRLPRFALGATIVRRSEQFLSPQVQNLPRILPRLRVTLRMTRYRFYAWLGRRKIGWGIRARVLAAFRGVFGMRL